MRVADSVRVTSAVQRLKEGDMFTEPDGDWIVTRDPEVINSDAVKLYVRPFPVDDSQRSRAYMYDHGHRVTLLRK